MFQSNLPGKHLHQLRAFHSVEHLLHVGDFLPPEPFGDVV